MMKIMRRAKLLWTTISYAARERSFSCGGLQLQGRQLAPIALLLLMLPEVCIMKMSSCTAISVRPYQRGEQCQGLALT